MAVWSKEVFAKNLNKYIERTGISQKELAEIIGVSAPTMNDYTKAKKFPRIDKIEKMANYFGILKSDLIEEKSIKEKIEEAPVEMAELHFEMVMDEDFVGMFEEFKKLDAKKKQIVKDLVHSLADADA